MTKCFQVLLALVAAKKMQLLTQAPVLSSPFSCVSHWLPSSGFLPFRPWVFFSQETKRRKRHKRNYKEPKRKKKNRQRSLHSLSHMNTTEGETKRNHKTKEGKKNRQRTKTNTQSTTTSYLLCRFSSLSLSHLDNTPKELSQHFLTYSIFVWSEVLPVSYSPMCSFLLTSSHSRSPSFLPFFLSSFLLCFPFFPPSVEPHLHSEDCNSNARRSASHLTGLSQAASIIPLQ